MILLGSLIALAFFAIFYQLRQLRLELDGHELDIEKINRILRNAGRR